MLRVWNWTRCGRFDPGTRSPSGCEPPSLFSRTGRIGRDTKQSKCLQYTRRTSRNAPPPPPNRAGAATWRGQSLSQSHTQTPTLSLSSVSRSSGPRCPARRVHLGSLVPAPRTPPTKRPGASWRGTRPFTLASRCRRRRPCGPCRWTRASKPGPTWTRFPCWGARPPEKFSHPPVARSLGETFT